MADHGDGWLCDPAELPAWLTEPASALAEAAPSTPGEYARARRTQTDADDFIDIFFRPRREPARHPMPPAPAYNPYERVPSGRTTRAIPTHAGPLAGLDLTALFDGNEAGEDWILEPLIVRGGGTQLQSEPGLGKSLLTFDIAMALANADRYVLGVKPSRSYRVVYIDFENEPRRDVVRWLRNLGYGPDAASYKNLRYVTMPSIAALNTAEGGAAIMATALDHGAEVVVIDTLSRSIDGDENDASTFLEWYRHTGMPLKREGIAWVRIDHLGKDTSKGGRGSSAKAGDVDLVWDLRRSDAATFRLVCTKHRMPLAEEHLAVQRIAEVWESDRLASPMEHRVETRVTEHQGRVAALVDALDAAGLAADASVRATKAVLREELKTTAKNEVIEDAVRLRKSRGGHPVEDQTPSNEPS